METTIKTRKKKQPKGLAVYKKMLNDKKVISRHLQEGGKFEELTKKGYRFATV